MRSTLKYVSLTILCSLAILAGTANAQSTKPPLSTTKPNQEIAAPEGQSLTIEFPVIEGWMKSDITQYPKDELGYSVNYDSREAGRVTVYVYNGGLRTISNEVPNNIITTEIERAKNEIKAVGEAGYYDNVKEIKSDLVMLGGKKGKVKSLHSLFNYSANGRPLMSEIYLFGYKNHFIKVRATYLNDDSDNKALTDLLLELESLFAK